MSIHVFEQELLLADWTSLLLLRAIKVHVILNLVEIYFNVTQRTISVILNLFLLFFPLCINWAKIN